MEVIELDNSDSEFSGSISSSIHRPTNIEQEHHEKEIDIKVDPHKSNPKKRHRNRLDESENNGSADDSPVMSNDDDGDSENAYQKYKRRKISESSSDLHSSNWTSKLPLNIQNSSNSNHIQHKNPITEGINDDSDDFLLSDSDEENHEQRDHSLKRLVKSSKNRIIDEEDDDDAPKEPRSSEKKKTKIPGNASQNLVVLEADEIIESNFETRSRRKIVDGDDDYFEEEGSEHKIDRILEKCKAATARLLKHFPKSSEFKTNETNFNIITKIPKIIDAPTVLKKQLKDYQVDGLNWLRILHIEGLNGILGDEMGLGKTIQTIAFLTWIKEKERDNFAKWVQAATDSASNEHQKSASSKINLQNPPLPPLPSLVVAPASTLSNWQREFEIWNPKLRVVLYHGSQDERLEMKSDIRNQKAMRKKEFKRIKVGGIPLNADTNPLELFDFDVMITTPNICVSKNEFKFFNNTLMFQYLIVDEAQMLKQKSSIRFAILSSLNAQRRLLLTGTPLQNSLDELQNLLVFLTPSRDMDEDLRRLDIKSEISTLKNKGVNIVESEYAQKMKLILKPFILRRLKSQVGLDLPLKRHFKVFVKSTEIQTKAYCKAIEHQLADHAYHLSTNKNTLQMSSGNGIQSLQFAKPLHELVNNLSCLSSLPKDILSSITAMKTPTANSRHAKNIIDIEGDEDSSETFHNFHLIETTEDAHEKNNINSNGLYTHNIRSNGKSFFDASEEEAQTDPKGNISNNSFLDTASSHDAESTAFGSTIGEESNTNGISHDTSDQTKNEHVGFVSNLLMQLRKISNHPVLGRCFYNDDHLELISKVLIEKDKKYNQGTWTQEEVKIEIGFLSDWDIDEIIQKYPVSLGHLKLTEEQLFESSGKVVALERLLINLRLEKHRVILFSQFTAVLDFLEYFLEQKLPSMNYLRLDGQTNIADRQPIIDDFNENPEEYFIMLASTKASGLGINLTSADTIIFYDMSYNPHVDRQAEDRCHRLGQEKEVSVYNLIVVGSVEEHIDSLATSKTELNDLILDEGRFKEGRKAIKNSNNQSHAPQVIELNDEEQDTDENPLMEDIDTNNNKDSQLLHSSIMKKVFLSINKFSS